MRRLILVPVVLLVAGCSGSDRSPLEPPTGLEISREGDVRQGLTFNLAIDNVFDFGVVEVSPNGILSVTGLEIGALITGGMEGYFTAEVDSNVNLDTGRGQARATTRWELTAPVVGTFECQANAFFTDYLTAYVERAIYYNCRGSEGLEGANLRAEATNSANPGIGLYLGRANLVIPAAIH